jgi:hypothetical protein
MTCLDLTKDTLRGPTSALDRVPPDIDIPPRPTALCDRGPGAPGLISRELALILIVAVVLTVLCILAAVLLPLPASYQPASTT